MLAKGPAASPSHGPASGLLIALCLVLYLPGFASLPPIDRDEPRFAQASKQMLESGDFVAIRFQEDARNKKPVGIYWMQAAAVAAGEAMGLDDARRRIWLYRLPSLLGAVTAVLATYWTAIAVTTRRGALVAGALMASTILLTVEAHLAKTDAVVAATVVLAMGVMARAHAVAASDGAGTKPRFPLRYACLFWTAIAVGLLVKGPITPMVPAFAAVVLSVRRRSAAWLLLLRPLAGLLWTLALVSPWFVLIVLRTHGGFLSEAVGQDMLGKVAGGQERHGAPPGSYLVTFLLTAWPLAPFALLAAPGVWRARRDSAVAVLLAWIVPGWLLFEAVPTKLPHYVLPLYPAIAILAAMILESRLSAPASRPKTIFAVTAVLLGLMPVALIAILAIGRGLLWDTIAASGLAVAVLVVFGLFALAVLAARFAGRASFRRAALAAVTAACLAYGFIFGHLFAPTVSHRLALSARLAEAGAEAGRNCPHMTFASAGDHEPSLVFLTATDIVLTTPAGAAAFVEGGTCRAVFVTEADDAPFRAALSRPAAIRAVQHVQGTLINGGKTLDIAIYVRQGKPP